MASRGSFEGADCSPDAPSGVRLLAPGSGNRI
jgi:hypothetical protein